MFVPFCFECKLIPNLLLFSRPKMGQSPNPGGLMMKHRVKIKLKVQQLKLLI